MKQVMQESLLIKLPVIIGDLFLLNLSWIFALTLFPQPAYVAHSLEIFACLNICFIPGLSWFGVILSSRIVPYEEIIRRVFYVVLCHIGFFTLIQTVWSYGLLPLRLIGVFYISLTVALMLWRYICRMAVKITRGHGRNSRRGIIVGSKDKALEGDHEMVGNTSRPDSLTAIKTLVYDEKKFTLPELIDVLDHDFEGHDDIRRMCLSAPKYGNDDDTADDIATRLFTDIADLTVAAGKAAGLDHYNIVSVNNSMSAEWGNFCAASACGRKAGSPMANANGASIGADKCGITALLNSMSKFDNTKHVGVINNVRFTKELFKGSMDKVEAVLKAFYDNDGVQTNLCVIGKDDLENAMVHPENYQNLLVRIGGFSARFVTLNPVVQREIIERTTYGA